MPEKFGYIINRLTVFFDSDEGVSFQSSKALDAIKQGGLKGQGMGEGILKDRCQRHILTISSLLFQKNMVL